MQRESCHAYIDAHPGLGWQLVEQHFDDEGCSGAAVERRTRDNDKLQKTVRIGRLGTFPSAALPLGAPVADFQLLDHDRRPLRLSQLAGQVVALTFIYTRCPLPDVCPRLSSNFARLQDRFGDRLGRDLTLLSVSIDPQHDRPEVLAAHARGWKARPGWRFLTGPLPDIRRLGQQFGLDFWPEEGVLIHSMRTAVLDRRGRLAASLHGRDFTPRELGDLVETVLNTP